MHSLPCLQPYPILKELRHIISRNISLSSKIGQDALSFRSLVSRLGYMTNNGISHQSAPQVAEILKAMCNEWRDLVAGSEGFLTSENRRGVSGRAVEWGDMDSMNANLVTSRHVNNVKYIRYAESGRIHWIEILAKLDSENKQRWKELWTPRGKGLILKTIKTDFKFPLVFPDRITVLHKLRPILKPDADSFTLDALILSEKNRRVAAKCVEEIVVYDYRLGKKAPMDDWVYEGLSRILEEQELWKQQCQLKLRELDGVVQDVERQNGYTI